VHTNSGLSFFWNGAFVANDSFQYSTSLQLGLGELVQFWLDKWAGETSFANLFPELFQLVNNE